MKTSERRTKKTTATWNVHVHVESGKVDTDVEVSLDHLKNDVDRVVVNGRKIGYVHHVAPVWVALTGPDLARAVEVSQKLTLDQSIRDLLNTVPLEVLDPSMVQRA
ncbi:hypothetical protein IWX78_001551 [Mycetocola sp. CAN_C7]|uniref:hypothetical protein n=1 Tax=Mycetocola sp. CAN_C7 TaxID=2787724 RepID=UPI0018CAAEF1